MLSKWVYVTSTPGYISYWSIGKPQPVSLNGMTGYVDAVAESWTGETYAKVRFFPCLNHNPMNPDQTHSWLPVSCLKEAAEEIIS
jgi:hypothetical protein